MTVRDLLAVLRRHWVTALSAFLVCVVFGMAAALLPETRYTASATVIVQPKPGASTDSFGAVEVSRFIQPALAEVLETPSFRARLQRRLPPDAAVRSVTLDGSPEVGTPILRVMAEARTPEVAALWANAAADQLIESNPSGLVDVSVIDEARRPTRPSGPLRIPILLGTTVLGIITGLFSALGIDTVRRRLTGPEELRERFGVEVIGEIPRVRRFPTKPAEVLTPGAEPLILEAYQRLRTNFEFAALAKQPRAVAITSCLPGEGKTSVTANLAWAIASLDQPVVVIDGDLRRPALHMAFGVDGRRGVADVLPGADIASLRQPTALAKLSVIPAGETDRHPTEAVATSFPRLLGAVEASDSFVLVDTPPLMVAEAALVAVMTGSVVLVVDASRRDPDEVGRAVAELRQAGADLLGVVLNRTPRRRSRRGSEYYYNRPQGSRRREPWSVSEGPVPSEDERAGEETSTLRGTDQHRQ